MEAAPATDTECWLFMVRHIGLTLRKFHKLYEKEASFETNNFSIDIRIKANVIHGKGFFNHRDGSDDYILIIRTVPLIRAKKKAV